MALDNVLIAEIISILNNGFATISSLVPTAPIVQQSYQPIQQGANTAPSLYLYKIGDTRVGWPSQQMVWNQEAQIEVLTQLQQYETRFQISAWATQNPADTTSLTASDYANYAVYIMQSMTTVAALEAIGCGIYSVKDVRNPSFMDERDRFEFSPSFDFVITHKQIITQTTPTITETIIQVLTV